MRLLIPIVSLLLPLTVCGKKMVCYYQNSAIYRPGISALLPEDIDPFVCTHIVYAFAKLETDDRITPFDPNADIDRQGYEKIVGLKSQNPDLKVLIGIGGYNAGSRIFSDLVQSDAKRAAFITNMLGFLNIHGFDGIDIDWEFPAWRDGRPEDKENFATFLNEIRDAIEVHAIIGNPHYELSIAVSASSLVIDGAYDVPRFIDSIDFMNILSYDFHLANEPLTNHQAPLYPRPHEIAPASTFNVEWAILKYIELGAPPAKIILGVPLYGRSWKLASSDANMLAPASGPAAAGPYLRSPGILGNMEICEKIRDDNWVLERSVDLPYAHEENPTSGSDWVSYDDKQFVRQKADYAMLMNLGGICVWEISYADHGGFCEQQAFSDIRAMNEVLGLVFTTETTNTTESTTTIEPSTEVATTTESNTTVEASTESTTTVESSTELATTTESNTTVEASTESVTTTESTTTVEPSTESTSSPLSSTSIVTQSSTSASTPIPTTPVPTDTPTFRPTDPAAPVLCLKEGFYVDPRYPDCTKFVRCVSFFRFLTTFFFECPAGLKFDTRWKVCNWPSQAVCEIDSSAVQDNTGR